MSRGLGDVYKRQVEFLVDPDGTMSFMEVNTRIQVEHPVTEAVTGVDLVAAQLAIAEGARISEIPGLEDGCTPAVHGHAIEFRINAEDPALGFVPFPGTVDGLRVPTGIGVRFDSGVAAGGTIPGQFDSMLAKLVIAAPSREVCLARARRALAEIAVAGIPTVVPFDRAVLEQPAFVAEDGDFGVYTRWIEEEFLPSVDVAALSGGACGRRAAPTDPVESWIEIDGRRVRLGLPAGLASLASLAAGLSDSGESDMQSAFLAPRMSDSGESDNHGGGTPLESTITGTLVRWLADDGAQVCEGDPIVVLEAMKMETEIAASASGTLHRSAKVGDFAQYGENLGFIE